MRKIRRYWRGILLGVMANFAVAVPALADIASDQKGVFSFLLPTFIAVAAVAYVVVSIRNHEFKSACKGALVGFIACVVSLFLIDVL